MIRVLRALGLSGLVLMAVSWAASAQTPAQAGYLYLSPQPGASFVSAQNRFILVRFTTANPGDLTNLEHGLFSVFGERSGRHEGVARIASDQRTVIFEMASDFRQNERVVVTIDPSFAAGSGSFAWPFQYRFMVTAAMSSTVPGLTALAQRLATESTNSTVAEPEAELPGNSVPTKTRTTPSTTTVVPGKASSVLANGVSVPSDFPQISISVNNGPSPGNLFVETGVGTAPNFTMILDNAGLPVWYRRGRMYDFKVQQNGLITWCLQDNAGFPAYDINFNYVRTYSTTNGYGTDGHDCRVLADGSYLMIGFRNNELDLSRYYSGGVWATVRETVVQRFTAEGELVLQWRAWDHFDVADSGSDFPHMNALEVDDDGKLLVSSRHLSEITKIDPDSGEIIWRLGGKHSTFTFKNDPLGGFSFQHHVTALGDGRYLLFDNGNERANKVSRAAEYRLDLAQKTAELVWQFRDVPDKYTYWLGSAQRLTNENTVINFARAQYPKVIEVDRNGVKKFELSIFPDGDSYRAYRLPWNGVATAPYLLVETEADRVTLLFNKFGDTNVSSYRVYAGTSPEPTTLVATSVSTRKSLMNLENRVPYFFRVTAVDHNGVESAFSNEESVTLNILKPGQNLLQNADFSAGFLIWERVLSDGAKATWSTNQQTARVQPELAGTSLSSIQLLQRQVMLIQGRSYSLEFDASSDQPRYIEVKLMRVGSPSTLYWANSRIFVTPVKARFKFNFTMSDATNPNAALAFGFGSSTTPATLDNVSLYMVSPADLDSNGTTDLLDLQAWTRDWLKTGSMKDLNADGRVDFIDFGEWGNSWLP